MRKAVPSTSRAGPDAIPATLQVSPGRAHLPAGDQEANTFASTTVLVLDWWVDSADALSARQADAAFHALVRPTLDAICG